MNLRHQKRMRILFDTECDASLTYHSLVGKLAHQMGKLSNWSTKVGIFKTTKTCKLHFTLPAFHKNTNISWTAFVDETDKLSSRYDMIIFGMNLLFSSI